MTCNSITSLNDMMGFLSKFGDLAKSLASNVKEMYIMLDQAKDLFVKEETTGKMHHLIDNIWCKYATKPLVNQEEEKQQKKKKSPSILSQDQHVFDEPAFIEDLDMLMNIAWKKFNDEKSPKPLGHDLPSKEGEREKNNDERIDDSISSHIVDKRISLKFSCVQQRRKRKGMTTHQRHQFLQKRCIKIFLLQASICCRPHQ